MAGMRRRSNSGFTLIELIVVMAIMVIVISLVSPSMFRAYEKIQAQAEIKTMVSIFKSTGVSAFLTQTSHSIQCSDCDVSVSPTKKSFRFKYIVFPKKLVIEFNDKGVPNVERIQIAVGDRTEIISLNDR